MASIQRAASEGAARRVIFSGIQPTGIPHLGNYAGALRQWVALQHQEADSTKLIYSIVDLHAITTPQPPGQLRKWRRSALASLLALGINPERCILFHQSAVRKFVHYFRDYISLTTCAFKVPAHSELMWILSCTASVGYLSRMTQWKVRTSLQLSDYGHGASKSRLPEVKSSK